MPTDKDILDCIKELDSAPVPEEDRMVWYDGKLYENSTGKWRLVDAG